jgi:Zn-dependent membrane protease YugP
MNLNLKQRLSSNWNLWRVIRLVLSIVFIVNGIIISDYILLLGGVFLLGQAVLNTCVTCVSGNCEIPQNQNHEQLQ